MNQHLDRAFMQELRRRLDQHLRARGLSRFGGAAMVRKTLVIATAWAALYGLVLANAFDGAALFVALVVLHLVMFLSTVGIAHDAAHGSYARDRRVNRALTLIFDLLGIDSHEWVANHAGLHHRGPNVPLHDSAIHSVGPVRLHPRAEHRPIHRYQHLYMFVIYAFATLARVFVRDLFVFRVGARDGRRPRRIGRAILSKAVMVGHSVVLPLWLVDAPAWLILSGCLAGHLACGLFIGIVFQTTHLFDGTQFPDPGAHGHAEHVFATTSDFAPRNPIVTWLTGGLNIHVAHHLLPGVSHVHLPAMARIVKELAREHGLPYREQTVLGALRSHVRLLAALGSPARP